MDKARVRKLVDRLEKAIPGRYIGQKEEFRYICSMLKREINKPMFRFWRRTDTMTKNCRWLSCYAGNGLAGTGCCFAGGDPKNPNCPKYQYGKNGSKMKTST